MLQQIVITREDGDLGFRVTHKGIFTGMNDNMPLSYEGSYGNIPVLRESINALLSELEEDEKILMENLRKIANDIKLPPSVRSVANEEYSKWIKGRSS